MFTTSQTQALAFIDPIFRQSDHA